MRSSSQKVVFLFSSLRAGGGERVMVTLANSFAESHNVDAVVLKKIGEYENHLSQKVRVVDFDVWRMIFALPKLSWYFIKERPHTIIATDEYTHILALLAQIITFSRVRVVLRIGNMYSELYGRYKGVKYAITFQLIKKLYRYADVVIANSQGVAEDISKLAHIPREKVRVIFNPKDISKIISLADKKTGESWLDDKDLPVVVAVGRLREQKGFKFLIEAFGVVIKAREARLVIVGAGRERTKLEEVIKQENLEKHVKLVGYQENPYAFMSKGDVYVHPSLWEGMPNALMEAMVCGAPVIAADCRSGPRELLAPSTNPTKHMLTGIEYGKFGVLVPVQDKSALKDAILKLLMEKKLNEEYRRFSKERARDFEIDKIIGQYKQAIFS